MHIQVKFLMLLGLAFLTASISVAGLLTVFVAMVICALLLSRITFFAMLKRVKWLLLMMLLIYAYSTPGEYLLYWLFETRPTYEGVLLGVMQAVRLVTMLAGLSCVIASTSRSALVGGLYQLAKLLSWVKLEPQQFALRVGLTLHYVEAHQHGQSQRPIRDVFSRLTDDISEVDMTNHITEVVIDVEPMRTIHLLQMMMVVALFSWALL